MSTSPRRARMALSFLGSVLVLNSFLVELSRRARWTIHQNFLIGLAFIVGGLSLAAFGYINPIVAAILHNAGSLIVVFNSARLVRSGEEIEPAPSGDARGELSRPLAPAPQPS